MNSLMMTQFRGPPYGNLVQHPHIPFAPQTTTMATLHHQSLLHDFNMHLAPTARADPQVSHEELPKTATLKHVKLAAFNIFGASVREDFQRRKGNTSGRDVEKWIGQRWREMPERERQQYHDLAREELEQRGGVPASSKKKRKAGTDAVAKKKKAKEEERKQAFLGCAVNGVIDDTFEGGLCANVNIECPDGTTKQMRLMLFHPSLANTSSS